jgi:hypothetical protein
MAAKTMHFRVDNGDMMLMVLDSGKRVLVDIDIRADADSSAKSSKTWAGTVRAGSMSTRSS